MKTLVTQPPLVGARIGNRPLRVGEFVPAAALTARRVSLEELENPNGLLTLYTAQRAMTRTLGSALPLETELKAGLSHRLKKLNLEIARFEHAPEFDLPTLDPMFLSWKTQSGYPAFSIFSIESDEASLIYRHSSVRLVGRDGVQFSADSVPSGLLALMESAGRLAPQESRTALTPGIPDFMAKWYLDGNLRQTLRAICVERNLSEIQLTAKYGGVMPDEVREHIHKWRNVPPGQPCFEQIFIVAEAPDEAWQVKEIPQRGDPLVIGVAHGLLWLIDAFDLTTLEKFAHDLCVDASKILN